MPFDTAIAPLKIRNGETIPQQAARLHKMIKDLRRKAQDTWLSPEEVQLHRHLNDFVADCLRIYGMPLKSMAEMTAAQLQQARENRLNPPLQVYVLPQRHSHVSGIPLRGLDEP